MQIIANILRSSKYILWEILLLWLWTAWGSIFLLLGSSYAQTAHIKKDTTHNGEIRQSAEFDDQKNLLRLFVDTDQDGEMDTYQYYDQGRLIRVERDTDADRHIDTIDYFKGDRRVRQEDLDRDGNVVREAFLDANEQTTRIRKDTTADGFLDTVYLFDKGSIIRVERDTTGDGTPNIQEVFMEGKPRERREDLDGDGIHEQVIVFDTRGAPIENALDTDEDGHMDLFQTFKNNALETRRIDRNHDGFFETIDFFEAGKIVRSEEDADKDGYRETITFYKKDRPVRQVRHLAPSGRPVTRIIFNTKGETRRVEQDSSLDGRMDTFQTYLNNVLVTVEKDINGDGQVDLKVSYERGRQKMVSSDRDYDGRFETTQLFDQPPWDSVTEVDLDGSGTVDERYFFKAETLRRKDLFEKKGRRMVARLYYGKKGQLQKNEIFDLETGRPDVCWKYNSAGEPVEAVKDQDKNGITDIWFYYRQGRLTSVEEDSNGDGKKDIWEIYDKKEKLVLRKKDIDYDGVADIEER
jgi:antitoxin component YwqK of YwqJK toxin-antitoxin module